MTVYIAGTRLRVWRAPGWLSRALQWILRPLVGDTVAGFALGHTVFALVELETWQLYHEAVHARQADRYRWLVAFWCAYLWEHMRNGYRKNRFEVEARAETDAVCHASAALTSTNPRSQ